MKNLYSCVSVALLILSKSSVFQATESTWTWLLNYKLYYKQTGLTYRDPLHCGKYAGGVFSQTKSFRKEVPIKVLCKLKHYTKYQ